MKLKFKSITNLITKFTPLALFAALGLCAAAPLSATAELTWVKGQYTPSSWTSSTKNALKNLVPTVTGNTNFDDTTGYNTGDKVTGNAKCFTDGIIPGTYDQTKDAHLGSGGNFVLSWSFSAPKTIGQLNFYTGSNISWGEAHISIAKIRVKYPGGTDWVDIAGSDVVYNPNNQLYNFCSLRSSTGALFSNIAGLQIELIPGKTISGAEYYSRYAEIEAVEEANPQWYRLTITGLNGGNNNIAQLDELGLYDSNFNRVNSDLKEILPANYGGTNVRNASETQVCLLAPGQSTVRSTGTGGDQYGQSTSLLFDNSFGTKWTRVGNSIPVTITMHLADNSAPVAYYNFASGNDTGTSTARAIASWRLEYSSDGVNWSIFDEQKSATPVTASSTWLEGGGTANATPNTYIGRGGRVVRLGGEPFRQWVRFTITKKNTSTDALCSLGQFGVFDTYGNCLNLNLSRNITIVPPTGSFTIYRNKEDITTKYKTSAEALAPGEFAYYAAQFNMSGKELSVNLFKDDSTKWESTDIANLAAGDQETNKKYHQEFTLRLPDNLAAFAKYDLRMPSDLGTQIGTLRDRAPVSWRVETSSDGINWHLFDVRNDFNVSAKEKGEWYFGNDHNNNISFLHRLANFAGDGDSDPNATGGNYTYKDGNDYVHVFTDPASVGTFTANSTVNAQILVVGGGASGGRHYNNSRAGGGGAGGFVAVDAELNGSYEIKVGGGGVGVTTDDAAGNNGTDSYIANASSSADLWRAYGGGGGAIAGQSGATGGSTGGGSYGTSSVAVKDSNQGCRGGIGTGRNTSGAGGGGAGQSGGEDDGYKGGKGGNGKSSGILGFTQMFAGGGGGGSFHNDDGFAYHAPGGEGGGGYGANSSWQDGQSGEDGLGGGGGAGGGKSGRGGSGIVVIRVMGLGSISLNKDKATYNDSGWATLPTYTVVDNAGNTLTKGQDYSTDGWKNASGTVVTSASGIGTYTITVTGINGKSGTLTATYVVSPKVLQVPADCTSRYTGVQQDCTPPGVDKGYLTMSNGQCIGPETNRRVTFRLGNDKYPAANLIWSDGTTTDKTINWTVEGGILIDRPTQGPSTFPADGTDHKPTISGDGFTVTYSPDSAWTQIGNSYKATIKLKSGYQWNTGNANEDIVFTYAIVKQLPGDYEYIEKLHFDGSTFVRTRYVPNAKTWIKADMQALGTYGSGGLYLFGQIYGEKSYGEYFNNSSQATGYLAAKYSTLGRGYVTYGTVQTTRSTAKLTHGGVGWGSSWGGTAQFSNDVTYEGAIPIVIGGRNNILPSADSAKTPGYGIPVQPFSVYSGGLDVYSFQIYESDNGSDGGANQSLKLDLAPVKRTTDNVEGLFDLETDVFYPLQQQAILTLDPNGGSTLTTPYVYTATGEALPAVTEIPTKANYNFKGYYTATSGGTQIYNDQGGSLVSSSTYTEAKTLYAQWERKGYTINYNLGGGTAGTQHPASADVGTSFEVSRPTKNGYTFVGWKMSGCATGAKGGESSSAVTTTVVNNGIYGGGKTSYWFKDLCAAGGSVTLTAIWSENIPGGDYTVLPYLDTKWDSPSTGNYVQIVGFQLGQNDVVTAEVSFNESSYSATVTDTIFSQRDSSNDFCVFSRICGDEVPVHKGNTGLRIDYASQKAFLDCNCMDGAEHTIVAQGAELILDGSSSVSISGASWGDSPDNSLLLFASDNSSLKDGIPSGNAANLKCYGFTVTSSSTPRLNLVPAQRNSDNKQGLYDRVSGKFYPLQSISEAGEGDIKVSLSKDSAVIGVNGDYATFPTVTVKDNSTSATLTSIPAYWQKAWNPNAVTGAGKYTVSVRGQGPYKGEVTSTYKVYQKVTLDKQNGTGGSDSVNAMPGETMPSISLPTRTGYTFGGYWTQTAGGGTQYYNGSGGSVMTAYPTSGGPTTLYAKWIENTYTVQFNGNGETSGSMSDQTYTYTESKALSANGFTRAYTVSFNSDGGSSCASQTANYTVPGWATSAGGTKVFDAGATVSGATLSTYATGGTVNLYAVWQSASITLPTPTKKGYTFTGWYNGSTKVTGTSYTPTANVTLTAHWTQKTYYIWYRGEGKTDALEPYNQTFTYDVAQNLTLNKFVREVTVTYDPGSVSDATLGKTSETVAAPFYKWFFADNKQTRQDGASFTFDEYVLDNWLDGDDYINFTGYWTDPSVTLPTASKAGYTFDGWYNAGGTRVGGAGGSYTVTDVAVTLTAHWTANSYTVKFDGNGSTGGATADQQFTYGTAQNLTQNGFVRAYTVTYKSALSSTKFDGAQKESVDKTVSYTFDKWNTAADGQGTSYEDKQSVNNLTSVAGGTFQLYAQWTPGTYVFPTVTRSGYTFVGWFTQQSGGTQVTGGSPTTDTTLWAHWTAVTWNNNYVLNGGTVSGSNPSTGTYGQDFTVTAPTREGYTFAGWKMSGLSSTAKAGPVGGNMVTINNDEIVGGGAASYRFGALADEPGHTITFTAQWTPIRYTITFKPNGGTNEESSKDVTYGGALPDATPAVSPVVGVNFTGYYDIDDVKWYEANGTPVSGMSPYTRTSDLTLYAHWDATVYYMVGSDPGNLSSFEKSSNPGESGWALKDKGTAIEHIVSSACDYILPGGATLRTLAGTSTFLGKSLSIASTLVLAKDADVMANIIAAGGNATATWVGNTASTLRGTITVNTSKTLAFKAYHPKSADTSRTCKLNVESVISGSGNLRVFLGACNGLADSSVLNFKGDMHGFTGDIVSDTSTAGDENETNGVYTLTISGLFGGGIASLPHDDASSVGSKIIVNYDGLAGAGTKGLPINSTTIPLRVKDSITFFGSSGFDTPFFPLMTFPAGTTVDPATFTVYHAEAVDGMKTPFKNLGPIINSDGTITLVANAVRSAVREDGPKIYVDPSWLSDACPGEKTVSDYQAFFLSTNVNGVTGWAAYILGFEGAAVPTAAIIEKTTASEMSGDGNNNVMLTIGLPDLPESTRATKAGCEVKYSLLTFDNAETLRTGGGTNAVDAAGKKCEKCAKSSFTVPAPTANHAYYRIRIHFIFAGGGGGVTELFSYVGQVDRSNLPTGWTAGGATTANLKSGYIDIPEGCKGNGYIRITFDSKVRYNHGRLDLTFCDANGSPVSGVDVLNSLGDTLGAGRDTYEPTMVVYRVPAGADVSKIQLQWLNTTAVPEADRREDDVEVKDIKVESLDYLTAATDIDTIFSASVNQDAYDTAKSAHFDASKADWTRGLQGLHDALVEGGDYDILVMGDSLSEAPINGGLEALIKRQWPNSNVRVHVCWCGNSGCYQFNGQKEEAKTMFNSLDLTKYDCVIFSGTSNVRESGTWQNFSDSISALRTEIRKVNPNCAFVFLEPQLSVDTRYFKPWNTKDDAVSPGSGYWETGKYYFVGYGESCNTLTWSLASDGWAPINYNKSGFSVADKAQELGMAYWDLYEFAYDYLFRSGKPYFYYSRDAQHANEYNRVLSAKQLFEVFKLVAAKDFTTP